MSIDEVISKWEKKADDLGYIRESAEPQFFKDKYSMKIYLIEDILADVKQLKQEK